MISQIKKLKRKARFGAKCAFIPLTKAKGIKLYATKDERDYAFNLQIKAHKDKIGPRVYNKVCLRKKINLKVYSNYHKEFRYGYITQIANTRNSIDFNLTGLRNKMEKLGYEIMDMHYANIGKIGRRLVCIDFDRGTHG